MNIICNDQHVISRALEELLSALNITGPLRRTRLERVHRQLGNALRQDAGEPYIQTTELTIAGVIVEVATDLDGDITNVYLPGMAQPLPSVMDRDTKDYPVTWDLNIVYKELDAEQQKKRDEAKEAAREEAEMRRVA